MDVTHFGDNGGYLSINCNNDATVCSLLLLILKYILYLFK